MTIEHTFMCLKAFMFAMHQHRNAPNWNFVNFPNDFQQIFDKVSKIFSIYWRKFLSRAVERLGAELGQHGHVVVRRQPISPVGRCNDAEQSQQKDENVVQAPPAENDEVLLRNKSKSRCEGSQAIGPENGALEKGFTGRFHLMHSALQPQVFCVSQVWFQNARAKWRRNVMRQDGSLQNPNCPQNLTSYTSTEIHTPNSSESDMTPSHSHALEEMHNMSSCMELY